MGNGKNKKCMINERKNFYSLKNYKSIPKLT